MNRPDFTGAWIFSRERSRLQIPAPTSAVIEIEHRDPLFRFTRKVHSEQFQDFFTLDLTTDGKEVTFERNGKELHSDLRWEGESLVFTTRFTVEDREGLNVVRYSLSPDGAWLTSEEEYTAGEMKYKNTWMLERS